MSHYLLQSFLAAKHFHQVCRSATSNLDMNCAGFTGLHSCMLVCSSSHSGLGSAGDCTLTSYAFNHVQRVQLRIRSFARNIFYTRAYQLIRTDCCGPSLQTGPAYFHGTKGRHAEETTKTHPYGFQKFSEWFWCRGIRTAVD